MTITQRALTLFNYPFRIFFIAGSAWAILAIAWWVPALQGQVAAPGMPIPAHWHAHEMIHGLTGAMIAGFLLTALANWTGIPAPSGRRLALLFLLWLAGRLMLATASIWPAPLVAVLPGLFYLAVAASALRDLLVARNRRNLILVGVLTLLALASLAMLSGSLSWHLAIYQKGLDASLYLITLLMVIIAGRITPAFSRNSLRLAGQRTDDIGAPAWLERLALLLLIGTALLDLAGVNASLMGYLVLGVGLIHLARLWTWRGWRTWRHPLLWVLHLAYLLVICSLLTRAGYLLELSERSLWLHTTGVGAIGLLVMGVITRVSLGHTGRKMELPRLGLLAYASLLLALLLRLASLLIPSGYYMVLLSTAALFWCLSFACFLWAYWPVLSTPRADNQPG